MIVSYGTGAITLFVVLLTGMVLQGALYSPDERVMTVKEEADLLVCQNRLTGNRPLVELNTWGVQHSSTRLDEIETNAVAHYEEAVGIARETVDQYQQALGFVLAAVDLEALQFAARTAQTIFASTEQKLVELEERL